MRSNVTEYDLRVPLNLNEALSWMAREPGEWRPFAGGTDLMVLLEAGKLPRGKFLSLAKLAELKGIEVTPEHVTLGALTTYTEVLANRVLQQEFSLLCRAAGETGSIATQNRGTLGGNIVNASPAADSPPALLVYDAELEIISALGRRRRVSYHGFHTGYKTTNLAPDELLRAIRLPRRDVAWQQFYRKVGTRRAQAISKTCFAGAALMAEGVVRDVRIALGSVAPMPLRCVRTEESLRGKPLDARAMSLAQQMLREEISPIDDVRSSARYRIRVTANLFAEFLDGLAGSAETSRK